MRLISVFLISGFCCLLNAAHLNAEESTTSGGTAPKRGSETSPNDLAPPAETAGDVLEKPKSGGGSSRKKLDASIGLKDGIDYDAEKAYSVAKRDRASEYFRRGKLLYETQDYASAAEAFKLAYETLPHQAVLGNIGLCYDRAGKWPNAVTYYRQYFLDPVPHKENRRMRNRLNELNGLVGELVIDCTLNDCTIRIDGMAMGKAPAESVVLPGEHRIEALVDGKVVDDTIMTVDAREIVTIEFTESERSERRSLRNAPKAAIPEGETPVAVEVHPGLRPGFWVATGVTVAAGVTAATFGALTVKKLDDYEDSNRTDHRLKEQGLNFKLTTNVMAGVAGGAAVIAIALAIADLSRSKQSKKPPVTLSPGPGFGIAGTF